MRFIADENIPLLLIKVLRRKGYSVTDLKEKGYASKSDQEIMAISKKEKRIIITFDKDFSTYPVQQHAGVALLRYKDKSSQNATTLFCYFLDLPLKNRLENSLCEIFDNHVIIHTR